MKKTIKLLLISTVLFTCLLPQVHASDSTGNSSTSGGDVGGWKSGVGCLWNTSYSTNAPDTYMIDLVKKSSTQKNYTIIASAIVGKKATTSKDFVYKTRENVTAYSTAKTKKVTKVSQIKDLKTLAKYMEYKGDIGAVGKGLSDKAIWEMYRQLGVATKDKTGNYSLNDSTMFNIQQSPSISENYGYRILIQEFHTYKPSNCTSSGATKYLLRKESANARNVTFTSGGKKHELYISDTNVLGIKKMTESPLKLRGKTDAQVAAYAEKQKELLKDPLSGAGYNAIWMNMNGILEQYKCKQVGTTPKCKIQKYDSKNRNWEDVKTNFDCNGQTTYRDSKGKVYGLSESCPTPKAECSEKNNEYGKCIIKTTIGKYHATEEVDCNNNAGTGGKTSYNGISLTPNCPFKPKWNYDIDAVCENCDSTTTGGSYHVQDVVDWEAVLHSIERTDKPTLQNYYNKGNGILCREEFNVVFPNENNTKNIGIDAGRYFTINEKGSNYIDGVYNFEPIKVTRTRQCISTNTNTASAQAALTSFSNKTAINNLGTVSLKYDEKYDKSKYKTTQTLIADQERTKKYDKQFSTTTVAGKNYQILTDKTDAYFKLKNENLYRFVSRQTGISVETKPSDTSAYIDIEKPNLPVSLNNTEGATTALYYELPEDTKLKNAVKENKANYLEQRPTYDNVYRRGIAPNETACAKMYGINTQKYNNCVNERKASKVADVTAANKCLMQLGPNAKFTYICDLGPGEEENCYEIPSSQNIKDRRFICKDGSVCDEKTYNGTNYKEGVSCQPKCTIVNGQHYGPNGEKISKEDYEKLCPTMDKCELNCEAGYCCPDESMGCPVKGTDGMWSCPGKGKEIIYRTIDLANPFPGQTNYQRQTGANWCAHLSNGTITCKNTNNVATTHIQNNRKNKDESVYDLTPLYGVDLNATNMKTIRDYNDSSDSEGKHTYDDFTLTCDKGTCKSTFLRDSKYSLNLSGVCNTANYNDLLTCAERGR